MIIYPRELYLQKLRPFYNTDLIKVITGIRRCGKSCLLESVRQELIAKGVPESNVITLNLDQRKYRKIRQPDQLDALIEEHIILADDSEKCTFSSTRSKT